MRNQRPVVIWLMGMAGVGKTTAAHEVSRVICDTRGQTLVLDTDKLRNTMNADLGWDENARMENVRRYAELANVVADQGTIPIVCCATPLRAQRDMVRKILGSRLVLVELFCTDREELVTRCRQRGGDTNYYDKVGSVATPSLAGVNFPYESLNLGEEWPSCACNTQVSDAPAVALQIMEFLSWCDMVREQAGSGA